MTAPIFVRELLRGDHLEDAESAAAEFLRVVPRVIIPSDECHEALRALVGNPGHLPARIDALRDATVLGGRNDPTMPGADQPWRSMIYQLVQTDLNAAERAARYWYRALQDASYEADPPYAHRAVAAYLAGVIESVLENDHWAEFWLLAGQQEAQLDDDLASWFLGACQFVRTAMRVT